MTTHTILALGLLSSMTLATPVKKCSKLACSELAEAEGLDFSVARKFDGSPSGCVRYENGEDAGMLWVSNPDLNFRTTNCDGCKVMDSECAAEADDGGCDAHATKKGNWCMCRPGFRMNRGDNGKPLGGWNQQYHWNARNTDGVKCVPDEEYMSSSLVTTCSLEGGSCACEGTVLYGRGGSISALLDDDYAVKTDVTGNVRCNNDEFGDPLFRVKKQCICITQERCDPNATKKPTADGRAVWCECNEHYRIKDYGKPYGNWDNRYYFNGVGAPLNICVPDPNNPPSKYIKGVTGGTSCPFGYRYIEERSECLEAGKELGVGNTGRAPAGSWGWVPPYCSWQSGGDKAIHFNSKTSGNNNGGYTPICELDWELPTEVPTSSPTPAPSTSPTLAPSVTSTISPSPSPTKAPTSSPTSTPTQNLPLDSKCFDTGSTVEARDDACAGDLVCARAGYDGRHYGGCHTKGDELKAGPGLFGIINHCCSKVPDDTFKADGEKCIGGTSLISTCYKCKNQAYFWYGKMSYVCGQEEPKWENGTRCLAASCNRCKNKAKWVWNKFSFVCGGQSGSG